MSSSETMGLLNKVCKWRSLFAGWQLGTRDDRDAEAAAVRDTRELLIVLRIEVSTLTRLLLDADVFTMSQLDAAIGSEARNLDRDFERRFPGVKSSEHGLVFDLQRIDEIRAWQKDWKP